MISVVVPTRNNEDTIERLLDSLARQSFRGFEVLVVDSSNDRTPEIASRYPFVRVLKVPPAGINVARNAGVREAKGSVIAFTDGDCIAPVDWLESVEKFFETVPEAAVVGGSVLTAAVLRGNVVAEYYNEALWPMMTVYTRQIEITLENFHKVRVPNGNNLAIKREVLLSNPFDESIRGGYDEVELLWRLCKKGFKVYATPSIRVEHLHTGSLSRMLKRAFSYGRGHCLFFLKHRRAPLAFYGVLGAAALHVYFLLALVFAISGLWQLLTLGPAAYAALSIIYLVKGRGSRSLIYPFFDIIFYSTMATGIVYELLRTTVEKSGVGGAHES
ncbi:MAG: glycosyltransferase [Thermofilaceae archaeon]|nr:glycosyltransferase [Thermofilaceae archaeon]MCX8179881.1 glycosyltransferase [Thermofilaceae archaeon]MDW8004434.1 glycosyltransferase [Thermofilaceae archaeon]